MHLLTSELKHGLRGHSRTVCAEVEFPQVGQDGVVAAVQIAEHAHHCHMNNCW